MRDRLPSQVLPNGAVRMEQFDANGNSLGYIYIKRADEPIEEGTPYNVNNVLTDETADALGVSSSNPTPNEAFAKIAERIRGVDGAGGLIARLEENVIFSHVGYTESGTFTASKSGRYRITAVGGGGTGGAHSYDTSASKDRTGGGGGAGGVGVYTISLNANDTVSFTISNGNVDVANIMTANKGEDGEHGGKPGNVTGQWGRGGSGGTVTALVPNVRVFDGGDGGNGGVSVASTGVMSDAGVGGNITYDFAGQLTVNSNNNGYGIFARYNLGYGGRGGYGASNQSSPPQAGGSAGVVFEFLGV